MGTKVADVADVKTAGNAGTKAPATTPGRRLGRGLVNTAAGPVDVVRGLLGLSVNSARAGAGQLRRHYRDSRLAREVAAAPETIARELASAQEVLSGLPQAFQEARRAQGRARRPKVIAAAVVGTAVVLAGVTATVVVVRRSRTEEPARLPPSVDVQPRP